MLAVPGRAHSRAPASPLPTQPSDGCLSPHKRLAEAAGTFFLPLDPTLCPQSPSLCRRPRKTSGAESRGSPEARSDPSLLRTPPPAPWGHKMWAGAQTLSSLGHRRPRPACESSHSAHRESAVLTLAVHTHVPWRRGTGAEAAPGLQPGGARGWAARSLQERACTPGTRVPGTCESVLCLFLRAIHTPGVHPSKTVHTHAHTSVYQTHHHAHVMHTHPVMHTHHHAHIMHTPSHTHIMHTHTITHNALLRACHHVYTPHHAHTRHHAHTPHHAHMHSCTHTSSCKLPRVHLAGGGLGGAWHSSFSGGRPPPPGLQDTKEPYHMPTAPGTSTQFRRLC